MKEKGKVRDRYIEVTNIQQLLNEAEQDMKNSADQRGCYPPMPKYYE